MVDIQQDARAYARIQYRLLGVDLLVGLAFLAAVQLTGLSRHLAGWWAQRLANEWLAILGYLAGFGLLHYLVTLPLHVYSSFILEHRFGLSRLTIGAWLLRELKQLAVGSVIGAVLVEGFYAILRFAPTSWPLWATVGWVGFSIVLARIFPTLLLPIFYKTVPLEDAQLAARLRGLCERVGLPVLGIFRFHLGAETRKANAALAGIGRTRRVLVSDTLLDEFTPEEIEGVLAHELAHHRYRHMLKLLVLSALGSWIALTLTALIAQHWVRFLGLRGLSDIAGFPALMFWLSLLGLVGLPLQNGLSRYFEWQADRFAVTLTHPRDFASALRRLGELNLADPNPPRWIVWLFHDHPPITDRVEAAAAAARVA